MPENNKVPCVSVGREWKAPHALWNYLSREWGWNVDSFHHQLSVDVPQDVDDGAAACSPHFVSGMLVVLDVRGYNL